LLERQLCLLAVALIERATNRPAYRAATKAA
jgi:hypothetical protein